MEKCNLSKLKELVERIEGSCKRFDDGYESAAKDMSVYLRTLFYDTKLQKSLLYSLGAKEEVMLFFSMPESDNRKLTVKEWFSEKVFLSEEYELTRKDIMTEMCNKDGGAHYDDPSEISESYKEFKKEKSGGSCLVGNLSGKVRRYDNAPLMPSMRQMCYEVLTSNIYHQVKMQIFSR